MRKPRYMRDVIAFVFLLLGLGFISFGLLGFANIIKPTAHSQVQDPKLLGLIFFIIGIMFLLIQFLFKYLTYKKDELYMQLISEGKKSVGIIKKVTQKKEIKFGGKSPFIVYYSYTYKDIKVYDKSFLLWDKPKFKNGDMIDIYINDNGKSAFEIQH